MIISRGFFVGLGVLVLAMVCPACVFVSTAVQPVPTAELKATVGYETYQPVKLHLVDGSVIVAGSGFVVEPPSEVRYLALNETGQRYDLMRTHAQPVDQVRLDSVAAVVEYERDMDGKAFLTSAPAGLLLTAIILNLFVQ